jgi:hypothetical protein
VSKKSRKDGGITWSWQWRTWAIAPGQHHFTPEPGYCSLPAKAYENRLDYGQMQHRDRHSIEDILGRLPAIYQDKRLMVLRLMSKLIYKIMQRISDLW